MLHRLGSGPLGSVYAAVDLATGQRVALRGFRRPHGANQERWDAAIARFAAAMADHCLIDDHPAIQKIVRFGQDGHIFYVATEYLDHPTLRDVLDESGPMQLPQALDILRDVADALDYAAASGSAHADLTPRNILVTRGAPAAIVTNFGLAQARDKGDSVYLSPEQIRSGDSGPRSHIFSAGVIAYEILSGAPPFSGDSATTRRRCVLTNKPAPLADQPPYVWQILRKMMATDPADRYENVTEAIEDLAHRRKPASPLFSAASSNEYAAEGNLAVINRVQIAPEQIEQSSASLEMSNCAPVLSEFGVQRQHVIEWSLYIDTAHEMLTRALLSSKARAKVVAIVLAAGALMLHVSRARIDYDHGTVIAATGSPRLALNGTPIPISAGDGVSSKGFQMLCTDAASSVVVSMRGCRLKLLPGSKLILRRLGYEGGPDRQFQLVQGTVLETIDPRHRKSALFETLAGQLAIHSSGGRLSATVDPAGQTHVINFGGNLSVDAQGDTVQVPRRQAAIIDPHNIALPLVGPIDDSQRTAFEQQKDLLAPSSLTERLDNTLAIAEDEVLLRAADDLAALQTSRTEKAIKDAQALQAAQAAVHAIALLIETSDNGDVPRDIDLTTLEPVSAGTNMQAALNNLDGHQLLSYKQVDSGRYEFMARACDSTHTLFRVRDGAVEIVQENAVKRQPLLSIIKRFINGSVIPSKR
ncbi:MAG: serine/threonine-protein kinase [Capsulimonadaceae bacterium]|nr:serine/threonine-protein kinase [Capsulimonadaceae bacterium]